jgi:hypothetical protein
MNNIRSAGEGRIQLTAPHPDEIKRRRKIHPDYDMLIAVNL